MGSALLLRGTGQVSCQLHEQVFTCRKCFSPKKQLGQEQHCHKSPLAWLQWVTSLYLPSPMPSEAAPPGRKLGLFDLCGFYLIREKPGVLSWYLFAMLLTVKKACRALPLSCLSSSA